MTLMVAHFTSLPCLSMRSSGDNRAAVISELAPRWSEPCRNSPSHARDALVRCEDGPFVEQSKHNHSANVIPSRSKPRSPFPFHYLSPSFPPPWPFPLHPPLCAGLSAAFGALTR